MSPYLVISNETTLKTVTPTFEIVVVELFELFEH